jgi:hypothetical protein
MASAQQQQHHQQQQQPRHTTLRHHNHNHHLLLRTLVLILNRAIPQFPLLARHALGSSVRTGQNVPAARRARNRRTGRSDGASWARRRTRRLGAAPHRRRRSEHDPQAHGLAGSRGGVGRRWRRRCDVRDGEHALRRCGLFRKYVLSRPVPNLLQIIHPLTRSATDVLVQQTTTLVAEDKNVPGITASPNLHSRAEICYRTMPRASSSSSSSSSSESSIADMQLRPDLRLGASDAAVRRVAAVVSWFERMAGLSYPRPTENVK